MAIDVKDVQKQRTYEVKPEFYEQNSGEIMVIQNDAYSIKDLMEKFVTGNFAVQSLLRNGYSEEYNPEFMEGEMLDNSPDIVDVEMRLSSINEKINLSKKQLAAKKAAEDKAKQSGAKDDKAE